VHVTAIPSAPQVSTPVPHGTHYPAALSAVSVVIASLCLATHLQEDPLHVGMSTGGVAEVLVTLSLLLASVHVRQSLAVSPFAVAHVISILSVAAKMTHLPSTS